MKNQMNSLLIQITGELYFADGNFSSYEIQLINGTNVNMVGYSDSLKEMLIRFTNDKKYIYKDVPRNVYDDLVATDNKSVGSYLVRCVKGFFRYEFIEWGIHKASPTEICKIYRTMQYNLDFTIGCWVTDANKIVEALIGPDKFEELFWQAEYTEIPENCQRIK
jgi:hypothetical protein